MTDNDSPDKTPIEASVERAFRRGNINFDFLQPGIRENEEVDSKRSERRGGARHGKRGLFNRGRPSAPVSKAQMYLWVLLCAGSAASLGFLFVAGKSVILLLALPVLIGSFLWSVVMLTLFLARPR